MLTPLHTAKTIADLVKTRETSAGDVADFYLKRIRALDPALGCFLLVDEGDVKKQTAAVDERIRRGEGNAMPLAGVPIGVKDAIVTQGLRTTAGSKMLADFVPPYDATVITRLKQAGAIILGKTNMDEFAMGSSNENSAFKPCRNPWDPSRVPGGSSGGSAAAVAAGLCPVTLGSDTGGSIRQPAALCGISGLKPTYGRVSRLGLIAFGSSLDQIGPMGRSVEDVAAILQAIAGEDEGDATSVRDPVPDFVGALAQVGSIRGLRIGIPSEYFQQGLDPAVEKHVRAALALFEKQGAQLVPISLPHSPHAISVYYMVATAEAASNLSRFDGVRYGFRATLPPDASLEMMYEKTRGEGFGPEVKRRIMLGTYVLRSGYVDAYYKRAGQVRTLIRRDFEQAFAQCDVIATPTSPVAAFRSGEHITDPLTMYLNDIYTIGCNLAGIPGLSIPCGFVETQGKKLPVGLQWIGPALSEQRLLQLGHLYQQWTSFHLTSPAEGDLS